MSRQKGKRNSNKRRNYKSYNSNYTNTSEAYDYDIEEKEYSEQVPTRVVRRKVIRRKKKKPGTRYKYDIDKQGKVSFLTYVIIFTLFAGCVVNVVIYANMNLRALQLDQLHDQLKTAEVENSQLQLEISNSYNLSEIEKIASTRLGMSKPQPHQLIHITIDKSDNVTHGSNIVANSTNSKNLDSFSIKNVFAKLISGN